MPVLQASFGTAQERAEIATAKEILCQTPLENLDKTVKALMRERPGKEVREAMLEWLATVPLSEFNRLKAIYLVHFGHTTE